MKTRSVKEKKIPPVPLVMYYGLLALILLWMGVNWLTGAPQTATNQQENNLNTVETSATTYSLEEGH